MHLTADAQDCRGVCIYWNSVGGTVKVEHVSSAGDLTAPWWGHGMSNHRWSGLWFCFMRLRVPYEGVVMGSAERVEMIRQTSYSISSDQSRLISSYWVSLGRSGLVPWSRIAGAGHSWIILYMKTLQLFGVIYALKPLSTFCMLERSEKCR